MYDSPLQTNLKLHLTIILFTIDVFNNDVKIVAIICNVLHITLEGSV